MSGIADILARIGRLETDVGLVKTDVAGMKVRLEHMPSTVKTGSMIFGGALLLGGIIWGVVQFAGPGILETAVQAAMQEAAKK